jgi:hypothetical protein
MRMNIVYFLGRGSNLLALSNAWKLARNAHISAQPLPVLKFEVVAEIPIERAHDVVDFFPR